MEPGQTFRELGFYPGAVKGSYYRLEPRFVQAYPLSHDQWAVLVGTAPATEALVFATAEAAAVWLVVEGLCVRGGA